ncbi:MAG: DeoR family transcriptional regulator [Adlercreutzia equolifaciens]
MGSRTLTERHRLGVSPATVRNDLSALEDAGFIQQPHTLPGACPPTPATAPSSTSCSRRDWPRRSARTRPWLTSCAPRPRSWTRSWNAPRRPSRALTNCLSIVMAPSVLAGRIRQITLVSLSPWQAIVIVVAEDGQVVNRTVTFADEVSADELAGAQNLLNRVLAGHSARDVRRSMDAGTVEALSDPLVQLIIDEVIECLGESESARAHSLGVSALLRQPEFSDSKALLPVIEVLEDDRVLLNTFDEAAAEGGPVMRAHRAREPRLRSSPVSLSWPALWARRVRRASSPSSAPPGHELRARHPRRPRRPVRAARRVDVRYPRIRKSERRKAKIHLSWPQLRTSTKSSASPATPPKPRSRKHFAIGRGSCTRT